MKQRSAVEKYLYLEFLRRLAERYVTAVSESGLHAAGGPAYQAREHLLEEIADVFAAQYLDRIEELPNPFGNFNAYVDAAANAVQFPLELESSKGQIELALDWVAAGNPKVTYCVVDAKTRLTVCSFCQLEDAMSFLDHTTSALYVERRQDGIVATTMTAVIFPVSLAEQAKRAVQPPESVQVPHRSAFTPSISAQACQEAHEEIDDVLNGDPEREEPRFAAGEALVDDEIMDILTGAGPLAAARLTPWLSEIDGDVSAIRDFVREVSANGVLFPGIDIAKLWLHRGVLGYQLEEAISAASQTAKPTTFSFDYDGSTYSSDTVPGVIEEYFHRVGFDLDAVANAPQIVLELPAAADGRRRIVNSIPFPLFVCDVYSTLPIAVQDRAATAAMTAIPGAHAAEHVMLAQCAQWNWEKATTKLAFLHYFSDFVVKEKEKYGVKSFAALLASFSQKYQAGNEIDGDLLIDDAFVPSRASDTVATFFCKNGIVETGVMTNKQILHGYFEDPHAHRVRVEYACGVARRLKFEGCGVEFAYTEGLLEEIWSFVPTAVLYEDAQVAGEAVMTALRQIHAKHSTPQIGHPETWVTPTAGMAHAE